MNIPRRRAELFSGYLHDGGTVAAWPGLAVLTTEVGDGVAW